MANNSQLSDTSLEMNVNAIAEACESYCSKLNSTTEDITNIPSNFSPLTENGIAVNLIQSVVDSVNSLTTIVNDSLAMIKSSLEAQVKADGQAKNSIYQGSNYYGGGGGGGSNNNQSSEVITADSEVVAETTPLEVNDDAVIAVVDLEDVEKTKLIDAFDSILKDSISLLYDDSNSTKIKELLLQSPNISDDLKEKIAKMDENELQVFLREMYSSGSTISDFSRAIITIFDSDLKENFENATAIDSIDSISKVYSYITNHSNFQDEIKEIYLGSSLIKNVDDSVIFFTRSFIDSIAQASGTTYEEVLNDAKFKNTLLEGAKELASTYEVLKNVKEYDKSSLDNLYSSLLIRG